jgi:hypothetical protein
MVAALVLVEEVEMFCVDPSEVVMLIGPQPWCREVTDDVGDEVELAMAARATVFDDLPVADKDECGFPANQPPRLLSNLSYQGSEQGLAWLDMTTGQVPETGKH